MLIFKQLECPASGNISLAPQGFKSLILNPGKWEFIYLKNLFVACDIIHNLGDLLKAEFRFLSKLIYLVMHTKQKPIERGDCLDFLPDFN